MGRLRQASLTTHSEIHTSRLRGRPCGRLAAVAPPARVFADCFACRIRRVIHRVCVFCGSNAGSDPAYTDAARIGRVRERGPHLLSVK